MKPHELEIIKEELGLTGIDDPGLLRAAIREKLERMNTLDRYAVKANIGRKQRRAEGQLPGELYSPPSRFLLAATGLCIAFSVASILVVMETELLIGFKILAGIVGVWFALLAFAGVRVIVHRLVNRRDL